MAQTLLLPTVGAIADKFGVNVHQIDYAIAKLGLQPAGRAGRYAVYSADDVTLIGQELARIETARATKGGKVADGGAGAR